MPFTGRLGTKNSYLSNIVLGIADEFDGNGFGFSVHVLTSKQIRVVFDHPVTAGTALHVLAYTLTSIATPGTAITPSIVSVTFYDESRMSVVLTTDIALTYNTDYSMQVAGVQDDLGNTVSAGAKNFTANVQDPPRVLGAYLSTRGFVDILFDRSVGPTALAVGARIRGSTVSPPGTLMTQSTWASSGLPATTIRFALPAGMSAANSFVIDLTNVIDQSLNTNAETVALGLVLRGTPPYSFANLTQTQIIDAYVADVSNDLINTATVRVYFNCNLNYAQSLNTSNWTVAFANDHKNTDTVNTITAANASDPGTLITLVNNLKAKINLHELSEFVHFQTDTYNPITTSDATDLPTATALLNQIQTAYLAHLSQPGVHLYQDAVNNFVFVDTTGNQSLAISTANTVKTKYTAHIQSTYPTTFSSQYANSALGATPITNALPFASVTNPHNVSAFVSPDTGPYTFFVDLHVNCPINGAPIVVTAALTSEDGGSSTNTGNFTGSITARGSSTPAQSLSASSYTDTGFSIQFDREVSVVDVDNVQIFSSALANVGGTPRLSATLPSIIWFLNNLLYAYTYHISFSGAGHQFVDNLNVVLPSDYLTSIQLASAIASANRLKSVMNSHMVSPVYHYQADSVLVTASDAVDLPSLIKLCDSLRYTFLHHDTSGDHGPPVPTYHGIHLTPGLRVFSARLYNLLYVDFNSILDGYQYTITAPLLDILHDNSLGTDTIHRTSLSQALVGIATRPSLASALPIPGHINTNPHSRLNADSVQVFFSKPILRVALDQTNLSLTGGSIVVKEASWVTETIASIRVSNMTVAQYALQAIGLTDESGNPVYT